MNASLHILAFCIVSGYEVVFFLVGAFVEGKRIHPSTYSLARLLMIGSRVSKIRGTPRQVEDSSIVIT